MGLFGIKIGVTNIDPKKGCDRCGRTGVTCYQPRGTGLFGFGPFWCKQCLHTTGRW